MNDVFGKCDLLCLSHLRWNSVFQRPHHFMTRAAQNRRVIFWEEPTFDADATVLELLYPQKGLCVAIPHLPRELARELDGSGPRVAQMQRTLLDRLLDQSRVDQYVLWYYTPMALDFSRHLRPVATVYDCMDELSAFAGAPPELLQLERSLLQRADLVLTGGQSLYEAKAALHNNIHPVPSSVDFGHFAKARVWDTEPVDHRGIGHPRLGYIGVIDERMDLDLVRGLAAAWPSWQLVFVGPVMKIDPGTLPQAPNIHYLGSKPYAELPGYLAAWEVALLPFARNASTRFISPTKTPEYLAAGKTVVSTSIRDVVRPYGERGLVRIADTVETFGAAVEAALGESREERLRHVDRFLAHMSWDQTWQRICSLLGEIPTVREQITGAPVAADHREAMAEAFPADALTVPWAGAAEARGVEHV